MPNGPAKLRIPLIVCASKPQNSVNMVQNNMSITSNALLSGKNKNGK
ncbi:hypothetical protein ECW26_40070 [Escherichia coli W26]|nr:hypothetical protein ECW26_40070 [Escherichia coli W26]